ncbi:MAG TPA: helix-turn-helix domain-containing protein, partial [Clostridiales bacterium]|nr:helix-turn-helix domain-containing protein [Clostridiales bacterium]HPV02854.1 helix-turn-helix domain-containing protein [Clostridiales bacterium]
MRKGSGPAGGQISFFDEIYMANGEPAPDQKKGLLLDKEKEVFSFSEVCRILSISSATGRNWIRLGKLVPVDAAARRPVFARSEIERVIAAVAAGDRVL